MQRLRYSLANTSENIFIKNDGLLASYGIFGAPGSGKTYLLLYLLEQLLKLQMDNPNKKYGALILDPKAALIDDVKEMVRRAGREEDLMVLNTYELEQRHQSVNVIDCALDPYELGQTLVLAAQSAGVGVSDPYWFLSWSNLFGASLFLLNRLEDVVTLQQLLNAILFVEQISDKIERPIQRLAREAREELSTLSKNEQQDTLQAIHRIENFFSHSGGNDNIATVNEVITRAYSAFQQSRFACYSPLQSKTARPTTFYDQIIDEGKIILVSVSPSDPGMAKTLCTLVKCLFQQTVLGRLERVRAKTLRNFERPLVLACDEFSQIASEVPGQPMGDGNFFSLSRQCGCMGLLATQSVNVLQATSLKEAWRSIFSNFGAKIFMRLVDNETTEEASKLAGEVDWYISSAGTSRGKDGLGSSAQKELRERKSLPTEVLTQVLSRGQAVLIGSVDGGEEVGTHFVHAADTSTLPNTIKKDTHA
jgi:hypothetical protein